MEVKITASIRTMFDLKVLGVNDLVGRIIGGLINHLSATMTQGRDELLEGATLSGSDKQILRDYFRRQIGALGSDMEKYSVRTVEAWVITKFDDALRGSSNPIPLIGFLSTLFQLNQDAYEKFSTDYAMLHNDLKIGAPVYTNAPDSASKARIQSAGVNDPEDREHLASIYAYITANTRRAVYVSTDYVDVIANQPTLSVLGIYCEPPLYAVDTYKSLV